MRITSALNVEGRTLDFVFLIACGFSPTTAAKNSGWAIGSASALLGKPEVLAALVAMEQNVATTLNRYRATKAKLSKADLDRAGVAVMPQPVMARPNPPLNGE